MNKNGDKKLPNGWLFMMTSGQYNSTLMYGRSTKYTQPNSWNLSVIAACLYGIGSKIGTSLFIRTTILLKDFKKSNLIVEDLAECCATGTRVREIREPRCRPFDLKDLGKY